MTAVAVRDSALSSHKANIYYLTEGFYKGLREHLSDADLELNTRYLQLYTSKEEFGTFDNSDEYEKTLEFFLQSTNETRRAGYLLKKLVSDMLATKQRFLDVGIGDGRLTRWLARSFEEISLVDVRKYFLEQFLQGWRRKNIEGISAPIEDVLLKQQYYDFCLLSHVLYYIPYSLWGRVTLKLINSLRKGGMGAVVLSGDSGDKAKLIKHFGGKLVPTQSFIENCIRLFGAEHVFIFCSKDKIKTLNLESMSYIIGFLLHDAKVVASKEAVRTYITEHCKHKDGSYVLNTQQKFIVIKR